MSPSRTPDTDLSGVRWRFTRRDGGVSQGPYSSLNLADHVGDDLDAVQQNRTVIAAEFGLSPGNVAIMAAAHGNDVAVVDHGGTVPEVDGLVTTTPGLGLLALAADCATVALVDQAKGIIGAVHSGWRGVAANAVGATVETMIARGADVNTIVAAIGPVICPGCYEVSQEVRAEVTRTTPAAAAQTRWGTPSVDLHAGIRSQLADRGVHRVTCEQECTYETPELFSYRRDGVTGRHGMLIAMSQAAHGTVGG